MSRRLTTPYTPHPRTHLLSNGQYTRHGDQRRRQLEHLPRTGRDALARGPHPRSLGPVLSTFATCDSGKLWSAASAARALADDYEVIFSPDKVEFRRVDGEIETHLEVTVSPENNCEVRRAHADQPRSAARTTWN